MNNKNYLFLILVKSLGFLGSIFSAYAFTLVTSKEDFGQYAEYVTYLTALQMLFVQWTYSIIQRFYATSQAFINATVITSVTLLSTLSIVLLIVGNSFLTTRDPKFFDTFSIIVYILCVSSSGIINELTRARGRIKESLIQNLSRSLSLIFASAIFIALSDRFQLIEPTILLLVTAFTYSPGIIISQRAILAGINKLVAKYKTSDKVYILSQSKKNIYILKYGFVAGVAGTSAIIMDLSDRYAIILNFDSSILGQYYAMSTICYASAGTIVGSIFILALPRLSKLLTDNQATYALYNKKCSQISEYLSFVVLSCSTIFFKHIILILPKSGDLLNYFPLLIAVVVVGTLKGCWLDNRLMFMGMSKYVFFNRWSCALVNVLFLIMAVPIVGISAAPLSTLIAYLIGSMHAFYKIQSTSRDLTRLGNKDNFLKIVIRRFWIWPYALTIPIILSFYPLSEYIITISQLLLLTYALNRLVRHSSLNLNPMIP